MYGEKMPIKRIANGSAIFKRVKGDLRVHVCGVCVCKYDMNNALGKPINFVPHFGWYYHGQRSETGPDI